MKMLAGLSAGVAMFCSASAFADSCTPQEATAKAEQLAAKVAEIAQHDPARAAELREQLKAIRPETSSDDLETECEAYERRIRELEEAGEGMQEPSAPGTY